MAMGNLLRDFVLQIMIEHLSNHKANTAALLGYLNYRLADKKIMKNLHIGNT